MKKYILVAESSDALNPIRLVHLEDCEDIGGKGLLLGDFPTSQLALRSAKALHHETKLCPKCCLNNHDE